MNVTDLLRAQSIPLDTLVQLRISRLSKIPRAPDEFARDPRRSFRRESRTYPSGEARSNSGALTAFCSKQMLPFCRAQSDLATNGETAMTN